MSGFILSEAEVGKSKENSTKKRKRSGTPGDFRLNSSQVFFTYPQCPLEPNIIYQHINRLNPVEKYIVAQEDHKEGGKHLHAYIKFAR